MVSAIEVIDADLARLKELGYKQELKRHLSTFANSAISFSLISIVTGVSTVYNTGLAYGGPISMTYGWILVGAFTMCVATSMAEICSAFPTSGGLYFWSYRLAGSSWGPFASWITGWFNILGQWTGTASVEYSLATLLKVIVLMSTAGVNGNGYLASKFVVLCFHASFLFLHAAINSLPIQWVSWMGTIGALWNLFGALVLTVLIPCVSTRRADTAFVFTHFNAEESLGIQNKAYLFLLGLLTSQYTLGGYDVCAHLTEETKSADQSGPLSIVASVAVSIFLGWAYILGITFAVTDVSHLLDPNNDANGYSAAQLFNDAFKSRYGHGTGGIACLAVVAISNFFCGVTSITSNSRLVYAFSRDGAIPGSSVWHRVNRHEVPVYAVWLSACVALIMALPSLGSMVAFQATVSIATISTYISYALPVVFRIMLARKGFVPGPFNLGRWGETVGWVAVLWVGFITILFSMPVEYPITKESLNYTPVAVGGVLVLVVGSWIVRVKYWFKGPVPNVDEGDHISLNYSQQRDSEQIAGELQTTIMEMQSIEEDEIKT